MANSKGEPGSAQPADAGSERAQLLQELDQATDTINWQLRAMARLKGLLYTCEDQRRHPTMEEIAAAVAYGELCQVQQAKMAA